MRRRRQSVHSLTGQIEWLKREMSARDQWSAYHCCRELATRISLPNPRLRLIPTEMTAYRRLQSAMWHLSSGRIDQGLIHMVEAVGWLSVVRIYYHVSDSNRASALSRQITERARRSCGAEGWVTAHAPLPWTARDAAED